MKPTTLKSVLLVFVLILSFAGCKKKDKEAPGPQEPEITYTLTDKSGTPGDLIRITTDGKFEKDTVGISIGGQYTVLYRINDTAAAFRIPVLSPGKVNIDLSKTGAEKTLAFTIGNYTPITQPDAVKKEFTDGINEFLAWADTLEDQSMVSTMKGLQEVFLSEYEKLSDQEKLQVTYVLQKLNEPVSDIARKANPEIFPIESIQKKWIDAFKDKMDALSKSYTAKVILTVGLVSTGGFLAWKGKGKERLIGVAIALAGVGMLKSLLKTEDDLLGSALEPFTALFNRKSSPIDRKIQEDTIDAALYREYDMVFLPGKAVHKTITAQFRSISQANRDQAPFYKDVFQKYDQATIAYLAIKAGVEEIRSWSSIISSAVPSLPERKTSIPKDPKTEAGTLPAEVFSIENISDPDITLKKGEGEALSLTATGKNINSTKEFTFDLVFQNEEFGIHLKKTIDAVYMSSELSVTAIAAGDTAIAKVTGGVPPYTFKWSNGKKDSILYKLKPGEYTVTVTDALDKTATASVKIVPDCKNSNLKVTISQTGTTATATANGGSPLYTYIWSNGATDRSIGNLSPGKYTVIVTDANGCSSSAETTIEDEKPDDDDESDSDSEKNPLFADAAAVKAILSANSIDVSDTSWDSRKVDAVSLVLSKNGCSIANNRVTKLDFKEKGLVVIPDVIGRLTALTFLNVSGNQINNISDSIAKLKILTALNLSDNQLSHIPEGIGNLKEIWLLDLSKNKLSHIPDSICTITKLSSLYLSDNELSEIPQNIGRLTSLTSLHLHNNKITNLPYSIGNLNQLTSFSLHQNKLTNLPSSFGSLTKLTYLSLQENQLTSLPPSIGNLTKLTALYLHQNQLSGLPKEIGNLKQLTAFTLYQNRLTAIPAEIGNLTQLTQLELHTNLLTSLPSTIGNLVNLKGIYLGHNRLSTIPSTIGNLTKVTYLSLTENQLTSLPSTIGNLTKLQKLYLHYNQLTSIPAAIGGLPNLKDLALGYNKLNCLPQAVWDLRVASAVTWLNGNRHTKPDGKAYGLCKYGDTNCEDIPCSEQ